MCWEQVDRPTNTRNQKDSPSVNRVLKKTAQI